MTIELNETDEKIAKDKAAVEKMKGAQSAMQAAISRIETLERALNSARTSISTFKAYVGPGTYAYGNDRRLCHTAMDDAIASITKSLGA